MTIVEISGERGCWELHDFITPNDSFLWVMEQKQEPIDIEKSHNSQLGNCWGTRNHAACSLVPIGCLTGKCAISQCSGYWFLLCYHRENTAVLAHLHLHPGYMGGIHSSTGKPSKVIVWNHVHGRHMLYIPRCLISIGISRGWTPSEISV